jgi:hypothetical protein
MIERTSEGECEWMRMCAKLQGRTLSMDLIPHAHCAERRLLIKIAAATETFNESRLCPACVGCRGRKKERRRVFAVLEGKKEREKEEEERVRVRNVKERNKKKQEKEQEREKGRKSKKER